jgi:hypothetical protein|tara:strand:- start:1392 stop:1712 length:321 start_codon:yes stop_codon:yes gene_type:complete
MKKKKYDPHHYTSATVVLVGVLVIAFFVFGPSAKFYQGFDTPIDCDNVCTETNCIAFYQDTDSDSDYLSDYDECIYGTNPTSADTDGDYQSDGHEVDNNTDPLIPN